MSVPATRTRNTEETRAWVKPILIFLVLAFGLSWLVALPLWISGGLRNPLFPLVSIAMMATPAAAALIVLRWVDRPTSIPRSLGLWPLRPVGRLLRFLGLALLVPIGVVLIALPIGALLGVYPADFVHFSGFTETVDAQLAAAGAPPLPIPIGALVAIQLATIVLAAFINMVPALGEELGWRGFLLPRLLRLGTVPAIVISGVIWGGWHAPLILLGYNYPGAPGWLGVLMMMGMCIVVGGLFGWLRLRSQSVWPAALAHGAFNAAAGSMLLFSQAGKSIDTVNATILGWSGWIVPAVVVAILVATGQFRRRGSPPVSPAWAAPVGPPSAVVAPSATPTSTPPTAVAPPPGH